MEPKPAFFANKLSAALQLPPEELAALISSAEFVAACNNFCDKGDVTLLLVCRRENGSLHVATEAFNPLEDEDDDGDDPSDSAPPPPDSGSGDAHPSEPAADHGDGGAPDTANPKSSSTTIQKAVFFSKIESGPVAVDALRRAIIVGEIAGSGVENGGALAELSRISQAVYKPMLMSNGNAKPASDAKDGAEPVPVAREIAERFQSFAADLFVTVGEMQGRTKLPIPILPSARPPDKETIHAVEGVVVTWSRQIREVLKASPEDQLKRLQCPGPMVELRYWEDRAANLNGIQEQLESPEVKAMIGSLEDSQSTYYPAFQRLREEISVASLEANDNAKYLGALRPYLKALESADCSALDALFVPILHTVALIWQNAKFYNKIARVVILLREVCNDIVKQATAYIQGANDLVIGSEEAITRLRTALTTCARFKKTFTLYEKRVAAADPSRAWTFSAGSVFSLLDVFMERCHDLLDLTNTIIQFANLENVEISGTQGKFLTANARQLYSEFQSVSERFRSVDYNIIDVEVKRFEDDYYEFRTVVKELERRLVAIIARAFDDCSTLLAAFKLLESFESLMSRDAIAADLEKKNTALLEAYVADLRVVQKIFLSNKDQPILNKNCPHHAGAILWVRGMLERINEPMDRFRRMPVRVIEGEEGHEARTLYDSLAAALNAYEQEKLEQWTADVEMTGEDMLKSTLLIRTQGERPLLEVNFNIKLVKMLREVKYLLALGIKVPEAAERLYSRSETFRKLVGNLELITNLYNKILEDLLEVERPLFEDKLQELDTVLERGLTTISWNSHKIEDYIAEVMTIIRDVSSTLNGIKANVAKTEQLLAKWQKNTMFIRKEGKIYSLEELAETQRALINMRENEIVEGGKEITKLLDASHGILKVSKGTASWKSYMEYVNRTVLTGIRNGVLSYIDALGAHLPLDARDSTPLIEIQLELIAPELVWQPELDNTSSGLSVHAVVSDWLESFMKIGFWIKRLDGNGDYLEDLKQDSEVRSAVDRIMGIMNEISTRCQEFQSSFVAFDHLWKTDMHSELQSFLDECKDEDGRPPLEKFEEKIVHYKKMQEDVQHLSANETIGWIKVDAKPVKQALSTWVTKWLFTFTQFLSNQVTTAVDEFYEFFAECNQQLDREISEDAWTGDNAEELERQQAELYATMRIMYKIRARSSKNDNLFEPLVETAQLLKKYQATSLIDGVMKRLEEAPIVWAALKKKNFQVREKLADLQRIEAEKIKAKSENFIARMNKLQEQVLSEAPFDSVVPNLLRIEDVTRAYALLDRFQYNNPEGSCLAELTKEAVTLNDHQDLFELVVVDYAYLRVCRQDLLSLKALWDFIATTLYTLEDWKSIKWFDIQSDVLIKETEQIKSEMSTVVVREARLYGAYATLGTMLDNLLTVLALISSLHDPSMRERHWKRLARETDQPFTFDAEFNLGSILGLNLHLHVPTVEQIVNRAGKELIIEKQLKKMEETWAGLNLTFTKHKTLDCYVLEIADLIKETLDTDNLQLQSLANSRYVQAYQKFSELVGNWQKKLGIVETCIQTWLEVQSKWRSMESIFVGSPGMREELPQQTSKFDRINEEFQELMRSAIKITNCVAACVLEGRQQLLDKLLNDLEESERALSDYLETKRLAFPRFYFISSTDLLDILANGHTPSHIARHLPKLFQGLQTLEFRKDGDRLTKFASGMRSGDYEFVPFQNQMECVGPVESWLNKLVECAKKGVSREFKDGVDTYDEKPRTKWVFDFSMQNTLLVSQVTFTFEVNAAFDSLEEGNENAMRDLLQHQKKQIGSLVRIIRGQLNPYQRKKISQLCIIDVHNRDILTKLIEDGCQVSYCFQWSSKLRYIQDESTQEAIIKILNSKFDYGYEYLGNFDSLVITPLTDRVYLTLTQAQMLTLGGMISGPAGTGKTETVKELSKALGYLAYVFSCSDLMDYKVMGQIFKGVAQTGAWGVLNDVNRIPLNVLSVCSMQFKSIVDALRNKKKTFVFEDSEIAIQPTAMAFLTLNKDYIGRSEIPDSLSALFRPVAMAVPDNYIITEVMLLSQGFSAYTRLSRKLVAMYRIAKNVLTDKNHYDWSLRNLKMAIEGAGLLKRSWRSEAEKAGPHDEDLLNADAAQKLTEVEEIEEERIIRKAIIDFNIAKLASDDAEVFNALVEGFFAATEDENQGGAKGGGEDGDEEVEESFEDTVRRATSQVGLVETDNFIAKICNMREIIKVRWSVFVLGDAATGKSAIWKTLQAALNMAGEKTNVSILNPKAVTMTELYGTVENVARTWQEGLLSNELRNFVNMENIQHQWIVFDGDVDTGWIESLNSVMDDNRVLTLASNERIILNDTVKFLFEGVHMTHCSPATVSRVGVIYIENEDVGTAAVIESWLQTIGVEAFRPILMELFSRYFEKTINFIKTQDIPQIVSQSDVCVITNICKIMKGLVSKAAALENGTASDRIKKLLEFYFVFSVIWGVGGSLAEGKGLDTRRRFSKWWTSEFKNVVFPDSGLVFDFVVDENQMLMVPWSDLMEKGQEQILDMKSNSIFISTQQTYRLTYLMTELFQNKQNVMLVGNAGTGKTALTKYTFSTLDTDKVVSSCISLNSLTTASVIQEKMEMQLEKSTGQRYGPPNNRHLIYFIDDMNMPRPDEYGTQSAIELLRQVEEYRGWYDISDKIQFKEIINTSFAASMNPTAGTFFISSRMQRHFVSLTMHLPDAETTTSIFGTIINTHFQHCFGSSDSVPDASKLLKLGEKLTEATVELHKIVTDTFLPSSSKFQYQFNLRDLKNVCEGLCRIDLQHPEMAEHYSSPINIIRMWVHEVERVFLDRIVLPADRTRFHDIRESITKKYFKEVDNDKVEKRPILYTTIVSKKAAAAAAATADGDDPDTSAPSALSSSSPTCYIGADDYDSIKAILTPVSERFSKQSSSNKEFVPFQQAIEHICRILRIITIPGGSALLVGDNGIGKEGLAQLASFICGYGLYKIELRGQIVREDHVSRMRDLFKQAGLENEQFIILMNDDDVDEEIFLIDINDFLANGYIPNLFTPEEIDSIGQQISEEVKHAGRVDSAEGCWEFFLEKVRRNVHIVLCISSRDDRLRTKARQFPAIVTNTQQNWFEPWSNEALIEVSSHYLETIDDISDETKENLAHHLAAVYSSVNEISGRALAEVKLEKRITQATPTRFIECIKHYRSLYNEKKAWYADQRKRLQLAIENINKSAEQLTDLDSDLKTENELLDQKLDAAKNLISSIGQEKMALDEMNDKYKREEESFQQHKALFDKAAGDLQKDEDASQPFFDGAMEALAKVDKAGLTEIKSVGQGTPEIQGVLSACLVIQSIPKGKIAKDTNWAHAKKALGNPQQFLDSLNAALKAPEAEEDAEESQSFVVPEAFTTKIRSDFVSESADAEAIRAKSKQAGFLYDYVDKICRWAQMQQGLDEPRAELQKLKKRQMDSQAKLSSLKKKIDDLTNKVSSLEASLVTATEEKNKAMQNAENSNKRLEIAKSLISDLEAEKRRWSATIENYDKVEIRLIGDAMLASAFLSYAGPFSGPYRKILIEEKWIPDLLSRAIAITSAEDLSSWASEASGESADAEAAEGKGESAAEAEEREGNDKDLDDGNKGQSAGEGRDAENAEDMEPTDAEKEADLDKDGSDSGPHPAAIAHSESFDLPPFALLCDRAKRAMWDREGLPTDRISLESVIIMKNTHLWPLLIDPLYQGFQFVVSHEAANGIAVASLADKQAINIIANCLESGKPLLLKNVDQSLKTSIVCDLVMNSFERRGHNTFISVGGRSMQVDPNFRMYIHTRLMKPILKPQTLSQVAIINFGLTEEGLEEQILSLVVRREKPDIQDESDQLSSKINSLVIDNQAAETRLLATLSSATSSFVDNLETVTIVEDTKRKFDSTAAELVTLRDNEAANVLAKDEYRPVAQRVALLYFLIERLNHLDGIYYFSLNHILAVMTSGFDEPVDTKAEEESEQFNPSLDLVAFSPDTLDMGPDSAAKINPYVAKLVDATSAKIFTYISYGLYEKHRLSFATELCFRTLQKQRAMAPAQLNYLITGESPMGGGSGSGGGAGGAGGDGGGSKPGDDKKLDDGVKLLEGRPEWLSPEIWQRIDHLQAFPEFDILREEIIGSQKRWREWIELETPEEEMLPGEWKKLDSFNRLLLIRVLRPDRLTSALRMFVEEKLGEVYVRPPSFTGSNQELNLFPATTPILFIVAPGVNVTTRIEHALANQESSDDSGPIALHHISMGLGQESHALRVIEECARRGDWVVIQNLELTTEWANTKLLGLIEGFNASSHSAAGSTAAAGLAESAEEGSVDGSSAGSDEKQGVACEAPNPKFRMFLSAQIEKGSKVQFSERLLLLCYKVTSEPPTGLKANFKRILNGFTEDMLDLEKKASDHPADSITIGQTMESSWKQTAFRPIIFSLCFFHAAITERKIFGVGNLPGSTSGIGWTVDYPFCARDLYYAVEIVRKTLENANSNNAFWDDIRFLVGDIVYGGHIEEDCDLKIVQSYLKICLNREILTGGAIAPMLTVPEGSITKETMMRHIEDNLQSKSPSVMGLHPNTEIGFRMRRGRGLCHDLLVLKCSFEPRGRNGLRVMTTDECAKEVLDNMLETMPEEFDIESYKDENTKLTPYKIFLIQEVTRMNNLLREIKRSLNEVDLGLKGDLTISEAMDALIADLAHDRVPCSWAALAWTSLRRLQSWKDDLIMRVDQLSNWIQEGEPNVIWLSGLFNPSAFVMAVLQTAAAKHGWQMDQIEVITEVTRKQPEAVEQAAREGVYVHGLVLEGARWDDKGGVLEESRPKEIFHPMPVIHLRAVPKEDVLDMQDFYRCPVYKTERRFGEHVFTAKLKSAYPYHKWVLAGVCMFLDVSGCNSL